MNTNLNLNPNPREEEEESISKILKYNPIFLEHNEEVDKVANILLPYSTGFEIECAEGEGFDEDIFKAIPNIIDVNCSSFEQRYRIPTGLDGFICLYNIMENLKLYSIPNEESGYHYHIDFTDSWSLVTKESIELCENYILKELESWNYKGTYNSKQSRLNCGAVWCRFQTYFKTMEIRIGEMSFDYELIVSRILHCQEIAKQVKIMMEGQYYRYLPKKKHEKPKVDNIEEIINNRVIEI